MAFTCKDCGQKFLSSSEYERHQETHLQTPIDKWGSNRKTDKVSWNAPDGLNTMLYKVFKRYSVGNKAMLCLYRNGQLNTAIREDSRIHELQDRLKDPYLCLFSAPPSADATTFYFYCDSKSISSLVGSLCFLPRYR